MENATLAPVYVITYTPIKKKLAVFGLTATIFLIQLKKSLLQLFQHPLRLKKLGRLLYHLFVGLRLLTWPVLEHLE
jgi:hypothetical protein